MMRSTLSNRLKSMLLLLFLWLADSPAIAEPEHRRLLDKDHLKGDFGPHPYPPGAGRPREPWEQGEPDSYRRESVQSGPILPKGNAEQSAEITRSMLQTFCPPKIKGATDINHLQKTKDGRWLFNSIEDEKLFFLLPKEKVVPLLGVPRKNTGGLVQYNCRVKDSTGYLELFIGDEFVQSSRIRLEDKFAPSKGRK